MTDDTVSILVESIASAVAQASLNTKATPQEVLRALAITSLVAHNQADSGTVDNVTAGIFDDIALSMVSKQERI